MPSDPAITNLASTFLAIDAALDTLGEYALGQPGQTLAQAVTQAARRREDGLPPLPQPPVGLRKVQAGEWIGRDNLKL